MNTVIFDGGKLKSGGEICSKCWGALIDVDYSLGQKVKDMSLEDLVYTLSSFKKTAHHKLYEAGLLSEENGRLIPGKGIGRTEQNSTATNPGEKQEDCVQCLKSLKGNKAFLNMGKLKNGQEICDDCSMVWNRLDSSMSSRMQEFSPADVKLMVDVIENRYTPSETTTITEKKQEVPVETKPKEAADACPVCLDAITVNNKVSWGLSKMKSGEMLCLSCWQKVSKIDPWVGNHMKQRSLDEIKKMMGLELTLTTPVETETFTEKISEASETTLEPVAEDLSQSTPEITKPTTETKAPDMNLVTNRSEARLAAIGITRNSYPELWSVKELQELTILLTEEEKILAALKGTYGKEPAALIATNERFILLSKKTFGGDVAEVYKLSWVVSVESTVVGELSDLTFSLSSTTIKVMDVDSKRAASFSAAIKPLLTP